MMSEIDRLFESAEKLQLLFGIEAVVEHGAEGKRIKCLECGTFYVPRRDGQPCCSDECSIAFLYPAPDPEQTHLYRYFDKDGRLLYVGISIHAILRHAQHRCDSDWFDKATNMSWESFPNREAAEAAEIAAIKAEKPLYNIAHRLTENTRWEMIKMREAGTTLAEIARHFGFSVTTVWKIVQHLPLKRAIAAHREHSAAVQAGPV
jgi:Homeodomain-like domain